MLTSGIWGKSMIHSTTNKFFKIKFIKEKTLLIIIYFLLLYDFRIVHNLWIKKTPINEIHKRTCIICNSVTSYQLVKGWYINVLADLKGNLQKCQPPLKFSKKKKIPIKQIR